jgi:hypothetical protein
MKGRQGALRDGPPVRPVDGAPSCEIGDKEGVRAGSRPAFLSARIFAATSRNQSSLVHASRITAS